MTPTTKETHALAPVVEQATGGLDAVRELARNLKLGADKAVRVAAVASLANSVLPSAVLAGAMLMLGCGSSSVIVPTP